MIFRDWEDTYKQALNETNYYRKENTKMSKTINEQTLRNIIRKVLQEKFSKNTDNTLNENLTKETKEVKTSNDDWYNSNLYESLKKRWTK